MREAAPGAAEPKRLSRPTVVHLVRAANGQAAYRAFLEALRRNSPGIEFDLVLALKGFDRPQDAMPYLELAQDFSPEPLFFSDEGVDLTVYLEAVARLDRDRYCFLNSFSEPLVEGWLRLLDAALAGPDVGMVGATGSWASTSSLKAYLLRLPSAYRGALPEPRVAMRHFMELEAEISGAQPPQGRLARMRARLDTLYEIPERTLPYERFPAYHLRTNAFMVARPALDCLRLRTVADKRDAYLLENGRNSMTRQLQRQGMRTLVAACDGAVFDHEQWHLSRTFWQGRQEGLLVADNQTRRYAAADPARRRLLSGYAWGHAADPADDGNDGNDGER